MLEAAKKRVRLLTEGLPKFPSLLISADEVVPQGRFAEAQAEFLEPKQQQVDQLVEVKHLLICRCLPCLCPSQQSYNPCAKAFCRLVYDVFQPDNYGLFLHSCWNL